jgi:hypothetical protein
MALTDTAEKRASSSLLKIAFKRGLLVVWIFVLVWFLLEVFIRVGFDALPPETQAVLQHVRRVPWDDEHLIPVLPFEGSREYHARIPPGLKNYKVHWGDTQFTFNTINLWGGAEGFRTNPPEWPMDIVAVGDSFAFCWTAFDDCWVERLHLDYGWHVMNLGVPGTGSMAHRNVLGTYVPPMEPAVVVWQWFGNDYKDDYDFAVMRGDTPVLEALPAGEPVPDYGKLAEYSAVYRWLRDWVDKKGQTKEEKDLSPTVNGRQIAVSDSLLSHDLNSKAVAYGWNETIRAFEESRAVLDEIGAEMVIVLIPTKEEAYANTITDYLDEDYLKMLGKGRKQLMRACEEHGWRCIDMTDTFQAAIADGKTVYNAFDFHLDATGNQLLTDTLAAYLIDNGLLESREN